VGITPDNLKILEVIKPVFSQLVDLNIKTLPEQDPSLKFQCLMLLDEFAAFGRMESIIQALPYMAGYNLRLLLILQTVQQIVGIYGLEIAKSIMTGCALQILYAPKEQSDAEEFSQALGTETVKSKSLSRQLSGSGSRSESESDQRRPLLLPQEIKEIGKWKEIIIYENTKPIFCDKIRYYKEKIFKERLLAPPGIPLLDLDTHKAIIEGRIRPMTEDDLDSSRLAINPSLLPDLSDDASDEEIAEFVNKFFNLIDSANLGFEEDDELPEEELNSIEPDLQLVEL
jgi:type IV secretion system protein VirD4